MQCLKCRNKFFKSFQDDMIICTNCGTLKCIEDQPVPVDPLRKEANRLPAEMVAVRKHIESVRPEIAGMLADGKSWKVIVISLNIDCHRNTARVIYLGKASAPTCGKEASNKIKAAILAKWDTIKAATGSVQQVMAQAGLTMSPSSFLRHRERIESELSR